MIIKAVAGGGGRGTRAVSSEAEIRVAQAQLVGLAMDAQPFLGAGLVLTDLGTDVFVKNLRSAAGQAPQPRCLEFGK